MELDECHAIIWDIEIINKFQISRNDIWKMCISHEPQHAILLGIL
jgi:hypothetical protein